MLPAIKFNCFLYSYVYMLLCATSAFSLPSPNHDALRMRQTPATTPLVDFQVSEPILTPSGTSDQYGCIYTQTLMEHTFGNSYGKPFVGTLPSSMWLEEEDYLLASGPYTPPPCSFNRVTMNFTVTVRKLHTTRYRLQTSIANAGTCASLKGANLTA